MLEYKSFEDATTELNKATKVDSLIIIAEHSVFGFNANITYKMSLIKNLLSAINKKSIKDIKLVYNYNVFHEPHRPNDFPYGTMNQPSSEYLDKLPEIIADSLRENSHVENFEFETLIYNKNQNFFAAGQTKYPASIFHFKLSQDALTLKIFQQEAPSFYINTVTPVISNQRSNESNELKITMSPSYNNLLFNTILRRVLEKNIKSLDEYFRQDITGNADLFKYAFPEKALIKSKLSSEETQERIRLRAIDKIKIGSATEELTIDAVDAVITKDQLIGWLDRCTKLKKLIIYNKNFTNEPGAIKDLLPVLAKQTELSELYISVGSEEKAREFFKELADLWANKLKESSDVKEFSCKVSFEKIILEISYSETAKKLIVNNGEKDRFKQPIYFDRTVKTFRNPDLLVSMSDFSSANAGVLYIIEDFFQKMPIRWPDKSNEVSNSKTPENNNSFLSKQKKFNHGLIVIKRLHEDSLEIQNYFKILSTGHPLVNSEPVIEIDLSYTKFKDKDEHYQELIGYIEKCNNLEKIKISHTDLTDQQLSQILGCLKKSAPKLYSLTIEQTKGFGDQSTGKLAEWLGDKSCLIGNLELIGLNLTNQLGGLKDKISVNKHLYRFSLQNSTISSADLVSIKEILDSKQNNLVEISLAVEKASILQDMNAFIKEFDTKSKKLGPKINVLALPYYDPNNNHQEGKKLANIISTKVPEKLKKNREETAKIFAAINSGDINEFAKSLEIVGIYARDERKNFLLHYAVNKEKLEIVNILIKRKFNPWLRDEQNKTTLDLAKEKNLVNIIPLLEDYEQNYSLTQPGEIIEKLSPAVSSRQKSQKRSALNSVASATPDTPSKKAKTGESSSSSLHAAPVPFASPNSNSSSTLQLPTNNTQIERTPLQNICLKAYQPHAVKYVSMLIDKSTQDINNDAGGLTALWLLLSDHYEHSHTDHPNKIQIARLLLKRGADISKGVNHPITGEKINILQRAAERGEYKLLKLFSERAHLDQLTEALKTAVEYGEIDCVAWLLSKGADPADVTEVLNTNTRQQKCYVLINKAKQQKTQPVPNAPLLWSQQLRVNYGARYTKRHKHVTIDLEAIHYQLAQQVAQWRQEKNELTSGRSSSSTDPIKETDHFCAASLIFIVSDRPHQPLGEHGRIAIEVPLHYTVEDKKDSHFAQFRNEDTLQVMEINGSNYERDEYTREQIRNRALLGHETPNLDETFPPGKPLVPNEDTASCQIYQKYQTGGDFERLFHHSEQALCLYLEDETNIEALVEKLNQEIKVQPGAKVSGVILSLHPERYPCANCGPALLGLQHPESDFMQKLTTALQEGGLVVSKNNGLRMIVTVSTDGKGRSADESQRTPVLKKDHDLYAIDLRHYATQPLLLQKDITQCNEAKHLKFTAHASKVN